MERPFDLDDRLSTTIQEYEMQRAMYWDDVAEDEEWSRVKELRNSACEIAELIHKRALALQDIGDEAEIKSIYRTYHTAIEAARASELKFFEELLRSKSDMSEVQVKDLLKACRSRNWSEDDVDPEEEDDLPLRLVWEQLCINDAKEAVRGVRHRVRRLFTLERMIRGEFEAKDLPKPCAEFLALVSRCYVCGLVPECVVMCRAAMEASLRAKVTTEHLDRVRLPNEKHDTLSLYIRAAMAPENQLIVNRPDVYSAAEQIKKRGDKAIHYQPGITTDALGTIKLTLRVIDAIAGS